MTRSFDIDQVLDEWLGEGPSRLPDRVVASITAEIHTAALKRRWRLPWRIQMNRNFFAYAGGAVLLVVAAVSVSFYATQLGIGGPPTPSPTPSPSPVLIARGNFVEHDWGRVEFEATRDGSSVTGHMTVGEGRGPDWPLNVELHCTRTSADGLVMIGGLTTNPGVSGLWPAGTRAGIVLKRGPSVRGLVWVGSLTNVPATQATECLAYLDGWLTYERTVTPAGYEWVLDALDDGATVEFGPQ